MSRRTRLWILALFLGLAVIPMVYLILTWNPQEPLRFRLTRIPGQSHASTPSYEVEVVNKSGAPILLHDGILWMDYGSPWDSQPGAILPGRTPFFAQLDIDATLNGSTPSPGSTSGLALKMPHGYRLHSAESITIPSHGARSIRILVLEGTGLLPQEGQLRIRYTWISRSRHLTRRVLNWLRRPLPDSLRPHLPILHSEDTTSTIEHDKANLDPMHPPAGQGRVATTSEP